MRNFRRAAAVAVLSVIGAVPCAVAQQLPQPQQRQQAAKPNFVFVVADDLGWADLGSYGSTYHETPNLDRVAREGVMFTQAYAACPVCSPTRAALLTGKYPTRTGITDYIGAPQPSKLGPNYKRPLLPAAYKEHLALDEKTFAEALKDAGYATFFAGKWHLGADREFFPDRQGFDINKGGHGAGGPYGGSQYFSPYGNPTLEDGPQGEYLPLRLGEETARFIEANRDRPFLAYLSFYSVHTPLMTTDSLRDKYRAKRERLSLVEKWGTEGGRKVRLTQTHAVYAGMVEAVDQAVGKVTDRLRELGLEQNTIIVFVSDNGGLSTSEGHPTSNLPLRGGKGWLYEGGIREPMIVKWPGVAKAGLKCDAPVTSTDLYPTILEMAGLPMRPEQHRDGVSLTTMLKDSGETDRDALYWHYPHYSPQGAEPGSAVRAGDWKLIWWHDGDRLELFNLRSDISEQSDLAEAHPEVVQKLKRQLDDWLMETGAQMPTRNPAHMPGETR